MVADVLQQQHAEAEARRETTEADALEVALQDHDRGRWAAYLRGDGVLTLVTDPPGARVTLYDLQESHRIRHPVLIDDIGRAPVVARSLPMGSYLVVIEADGHVPVRYPIQITRQHHWSGVRTGRTDPDPIVLPPQDALGPDDCYVPAGWFLAGGDPAANNSLPAQRLWLDGFVIRRFPVTLAEYVEFLNDLLRQGRAAEADEHAPVAPAWERGPDRHEYGVERDGSGLFVVAGPPDRPRWPVVNVSWHGAAAYAAWLAGRDRLPWRLVAEMEHEKAFRGVDGAYFPWGNAFEPTYCKNRLSAPGRSMRTTVDEYPADESIYGVRGLAGNVHSWCADPYQLLGPALVDDAPQMSDGSDVVGPGAGGAHRMVRGGSWRDPEANLRGAYRDCPPATYRDTVIGFRIARPFPG